MKAPGKRGTSHNTAGSKKATIAMYLRRCMYDSAVLNGIVCNDKTVEILQGCLCGF